MRNVVVTEYISLDGVIEEPAWTTPYWGDDISDFKQAELFESDLLLLGRATYEGFAAAWPEMTDEDGFADRMNTMPKLVATTTDDAPKWNARFIGEGLVDEVKRLKQEPGMNILVYGSATLVQTLVKHNLIDEYRLLVYPVVLGEGRRLFDEGTTASLQLVEAKPFESGVVALIYRPAPQP